MSNHRLLRKKRGGYEDTGAEQRRLREVFLEGTDLGQVSDGQGGTFSSPGFLTG